MNSVLLIRCVGPMQSWGTRSRFQERDTEREPSKSGVIGILCAALGRDRSEPVDDLAALRMGIRVDREGKLEKDFQTAQDVAVAGGNTTQDLLSNRYYLADAAFLVGFEGPAELLKSLHSALARPVWPLFLGRKSYVPSESLFLADGLQGNVSLHDALTCFRFLITSDEIKRRMEAVQKGRADKVRFVVETDAMTHEVRSDQPKSFALGKREFRQRYVTTSYRDIAEFPAAREVVSCT